MIQTNNNKYSISAMCSLLKISKATYYYRSATSKNNTELEEAIVRIFKDSRNNYGTWKIKHELTKVIDYPVSRKRITKIMTKYYLISNYTIKQYKNHRNKVNEDQLPNILNRKFNDRKDLEVIVSDLTYINIKGVWHYLCILLNIFNREIIGYEVGRRKDAKLVEQAFKGSAINLRSVDIFHTDRGKEFKNKLIEDILKHNEIRRSLSKKGCPYDNAIAEAGFKIIKTELIKPNNFKNIEQLRLYVFDYVNWYNNHRIHGSLGYHTPITYRENLSILK